MDFFEILNLILVPIYNFGFLFLFILWLWFRKRQIDILDYFKGLDIRLLWTICLSLFLLISLVNVNLETDVDDAVIGGAQAFLSGYNPYIDKVVPHYLPNGTKIDSVYHYFPPDLLTYSFFTFFFLIFTSSISTPPAIMLLANLVLLIPTFIFFDKIIKDRLSFRRSLPLFLLLSSPFLLSNSILMLTLFVAGYFFWNKKETYSIDPQENKILGMIFYVLSASVKYMTGILILVHFVDDTQSIFRKSSNYHQEFFFLFPYIISTLVLLVLCLPFGPIEVIKAVFLYQGDPSYREGVAAMKGPLLIEILLFFGFSGIYIPIAGAIFTLAFVYSFYNKALSLPDKQLFLCFVIMFILPFYATELFVVPLFLWFFSSLEKKNIVSLP